MRHGSKTVAGIKLLVRAPATVMFRKECGWPQGHRWLGALCLKNMRICYKCKKREGAWWDHICKYCRNKPQTEEEILKYEKENAAKDILTPEKIEVPEAKRGYNKLSIIGFILSITAIFGIGLAGLIGIVLGIISLVQIKQTHSKGKWLAIAAIIIGFIWGIATGILREIIKI